MAQARLRAITAAAGLAITVGCVGAPAPPDSVPPDGDLPQIPGLIEQLAELIIHSNPNVSLNPADFGYEFVDIEIAAGDGAVMRGWLITSGGSARTVIFHQGDGGNKATYLPGAALFVPNGYNLILYDYRGFGNSDGEATFESIIADAVTVHEWAAANLDGEFVSMGGSLGGPAALHAAKVAPRLRALLLDSPFVVDATAMYYLGQSGGLLAGLPEALARQVVLAQFPPEYDVVTEAATLTVPTWLVQSTTDQLTPYEGGQRLYDAIPAPKQLYLTDASHGQSLATDPLQYEAEVLSFLTSAFGD